MVTHAKDFNLAREAVLGTRLATSTPGHADAGVRHVLQAAIGSAAKIATGQIESAIAVGSDTTSDPPIVFSKKFAARLNQLTQQKSTLDKVKVFKASPRRSSRRSRPPPPSRAPG